MGGNIHSVSEKEPALLPIFRSEQQLRILGHLFVNAGREWMISELSQAVDVPYSTVSREVQRLMAAGILAGRWLGPAHLVRADENGPYFQELHALLLKAYGPQVVLGKLLGRLKGVDEAFIFGSWARRHAGEPGPAPADVDVLVVGHPDVDEVYGTCGEAQRALGIDVNPVVLTPDEWWRPRSSFLREVRRGPLVPLLDQAA
jgi:predicted nucleotidyltransferase